MTAAELARLTPEEKEAFHRGVEAKVTTFSYAPVIGDRPKEIQNLVRIPSMKVAVQVVHSGGENNLHYHTGSDTTWMVLRGAVRFYGPGDVLIAELSEHQGITIPGGARYWFEKTGEVDLELLQMVAFDRTAPKAERINVDAHKNWMEDADLRVYEPATS
jgi:mannose-6-phosphate isomerase-like protein (cupin superfamily)